MNQLFQHENGTFSSAPIQSNLTIDTQLNEYMNLSPNPADDNPQFSQTIQFTEVLSSDGIHSFQTELKPRLEGGFFVNDESWTCYRRNYFRVIGAFDLKSLQDTSFHVNSSNMESLQLMASVGNEMYPIEKFQLQLGARTNIPSKKVNLVRHVSKRDPGANECPGPVFCMPGGSSSHSKYVTPLSSSSLDFNNAVVIDRLQFRQATANNGKRKSIQQFFNIVCELQAVCSNGAVLTIAETQCENIVVRGRSPGHYADLDRIKERRKGQLSATPTSARYVPIRSAWDSPYPLSYSIPNSSSTLQTSQNMLMGINSTDQIVEIIEGDVMPSFEELSNIQTSASSANSIDYFSIDSAQSLGSAQSLDPLNLSFLEKPEKKDIMFTPVVGSFENLFNNY